MFLMGSSIEYVKKHLKKSGISNFGGTAFGRGSNAFLYILKVDRFPEA
jgi:hypothetical protein